MNKMFASVKTPILIWVGMLFILGAVFVGFASLVHHGTVYSAKTLWGEATGGGTGGGVLVTYPGMVPMPPVPQKPPYDSVVGVGGRYPDMPVLPSSGQMDIQNASLSLLVTDVSKATGDITVIARSLGGSVADSNVSKISSTMRSGTITIRVPNSSFSDALNRIKALALEVQKENTNSQDVSEQVIDLQARLKNLTAEEEQYVALLKKAKTIEDTLIVQQYLGNVRQQIEQIQAQMKYLASRVEMSAVTVYLNQEPEAQPLQNLRWNPLVVVKQALNALLRGLTSIANLLIATAFFLPLLVLWVALVGALSIAVWKAIHWFSAKFIHPGIQPKSRQKRRTKEGDSV